MGEGGAVLGVVAIHAIFGRELFGRQRPVVADIVWGGTALQQVKPVAPPPQRVGCIKQRQRGRVGKGRNAFPADETPLNPE